MTYVINDACVDVKDRSCVAECPVDCIYEGERAMYIHPDECIDCGACVTTCPTDAIAYEGDLDAADERFLLRARELFVELGSPGGSRHSGALGRDHASVAALPVRPADVP